MPLFRINGRIIYFAHIPKTGGTSLRETLRQLGPVCLHRKHGPAFVPPPPQHWQAEIYSRIIPEDFYDWGFMVVRNPYTRLLSEYRVRAQEAAEREGVAPGLGRWVEETFDRYQQDSTIYANHIRPQFEFFCDKLEVFPFEGGLQAVVDAVRRFAEVERPLAVRHDNVSPQGGSARAAIPASRQTLARIAEFYRDDFRFFGYDRDIAPLLERQKIQLTDDDAVAA